MFDASKSNESLSGLKIAPNLAWVKGVRWLNLTDCKLL